MTITAASRAPSDTTPPRASEPPRTPPPEASSKPGLAPSLPRFAAVLGARRSAERVATPTRTGAPDVATPDRPAKASVRPRDDRPERNVSRAIRPTRAEAALDRDPSELLPFRPLPSVLAPPTTPTSPVATTARVELARAAEQLVTRLRVGRTKEGAVVELRLALGGRELDLRLVETTRGIELHANDADDGLRRALARELSARGLAITIE